MASTIPTHYISKFTSGIRTLQQQMGSRFREAVDVDTDPVVEGKRTSYDQVDATSMVPITDRHGKTQVTDDLHLRRWVTYTPAEKASLIDRADMRRILNNPRNSYVKGATAAANRYSDDKVIAAFFATALTGEEAGSTETFDTDNIVASVAGGLNVSQLRDAREILEAYENEEDDGEFQWFIACQAKQRKNLLEKTEVTSDDYNTVKALVDGKINTYMGYTFKKSQRLTLSGTDRLIPVWVKASMKLAFSQDIRTFMDVMPERRHSVQIRTEVDVGSTRLDNKGVAQIKASEA
jgi:hypothetical protein